MGRNKKDFNDFTYGVGLEINASSFKQVKDDLKINMQHLAKMVKDYGSAIEMDPDIDISKITDTVKHIQSMMDGIGNSGNSMSDFVDKGVLGRISSLEDSLQSVQSASQATQGAMDELKQSVLEALAPLKDMGELKFPATFDKAFNKTKEQSESVKDQTDNIVKATSNIQKIGTIIPTLEELSKKMGSVSKGVKISDNELIDLLDQFNDLSDKLSEDFTNLNTDELDEALQKFEVVGLKLREALMGATEPQIRSVYVGNRGYSLTLVSELITELTEKKKELSAARDGFEEEQKKFINQVLNNRKSLGDAKNIDGSNYTIRAKIIPNTNEGEWLQTINDTIRNIEPQVKPITLTPTFMHGSKKNIEKELGADTATLTHKLKVNFQIDTADQQEFEDRISNIESLIQASKKKLEDQTKFKVSFTYEDGGRFKDVVMSFINQLKNIDVTLKLKNRDSFKKSVETLRTQIDEQLSAVPVTLTVGPQEKLWQEIDELRNKIADKLNNIGITLGIQNAPETVQWVAMTQDDIGGISMQDLSANVDIVSDVESQVNHAVEVINKVSEAAQNATNDIEISKKALKSLMEQKFDAPEFVQMGIINDKNRQVKGSPEKLAKLLADYKEHKRKKPDKVMDEEDWYKLYPDAQGDPAKFRDLYRQNSRELKKIEEELNNYYQKQISYLQDRQAAAEKVLKTEKELATTQQKNVKTEQASSRPLGLKALQGKKRSLENQRNNAKEAEFGLHSTSKTKSRAYSVQYGQWDDERKLFLRNDKYMKKLYADYDKELEIDKNSEKTKKLRKEITDITKSQKQHVAEVRAELEKELQLIEQIIKKYHEVNDGKKAKDKKTIEQIYQDLIQSDTKRQERARQTKSDLAKSKKDKNTWNFNALVKSGIGDVGNVFGTGQKRELKEIVEYYYKLVDKQREYNELGLGDSDESKQNLAELHEYKQKLVQIWKDQVAYCEQQIGVYDKEIEHANEALSVIHKLSEEKQKANTPATKSKTSVQPVDDQVVGPDAEKNLKKLDDLKNKLSEQQRILSDLEKNKFSSKYIAQLGEVDKETLQFKKNTKEVQKILNEYNALKDKKNKTDFEKKRQKDLQSQILNILNAQKKQAKEAIAGTKREIEEVQKLLGAYNDLSDSKERANLNSLNKERDDAVSKKDLLKKQGWNALTQTGIGDVKNRLKGRSYDLAGLLEARKGLLNTKAALEAHDDTSSQMYKDTISSLKDAEADLKTIYQDQQAHLDSTIQRLDSEISKEKQLLQIKQAQTKEEQQQTRKSVEQQNVSKQGKTTKKTTKTKTVGSTSTAKSAVPIDPNALAKEATLSAINGKLENILGQLGNGIMITGSNISIDANNVSVSGQGDTGTAKGAKKSTKTKSPKTKPSTESSEKSNKSDETQPKPKAAKETTLSTQLRQLAEFEERAKRSEVYSAKLQQRFNNLRAELNKANTIDDVDKYKTHLDAFKTEFAKLKTFKGLYDNLVKSKARQLELTYEIQNSTGSTKQAQEELRIEQAKSQKIEDHLSKYTDLYDQRNKELAVTKAIELSNQNIVRSQSKQVDKKVDDQNNNIVKIVDTAKQKLTEMQYTMQNFKIPMGQAPLEKLQEYERLLTTLKTKQQELANNPSLMEDEDYVQGFNNLLQQMKQVHNEFATLQQSSENFLKNIRSTQDIKPLGNTFRADDIEQLHDAMQDFANQVGVGEAKLVSFNDVERTATFEIKNSQGQLQQLVVAYDTATNSLGRFVKQTKTSVSYTQQFVNGLKTSFQNVARYLMSFGSVYRIFALMKQGFTYVKDIDSALTELKKVTDETDASYNRFLQDMSKTAGVVGSTVSELTTMAAEWARLGYSMKEAGQLAESTAILLNVSEFEDATKASEALISTMQAFSYTADESQHVVDILNEVGKHIARR